MKILKANTNANLQWGLFRDVLVKTAREVILKKEKKSRNKWITPEILELMKKRQNVTDKYSHKCKTLVKEMKRKCTEANESWLDNQCKEIEQAKEKGTTSICKKIKEITGSSTCSSSGCVKSKEGTIIVEKHKIL